MMGAPGRDDEQGLAPDRRDSEVSEANTAGEGMQTTAGDETGGAAGAGSQGQSSVTCWGL